MIRVLFVDDEEKILQGLQRSLRSQRREWEIAFAEGGKEAVKLLAATEPFDIIVSDISMPGIDGIRLLNYVKDAYPSMMRITLTGNTDKETALESAKVAHQYLSKPSDVETLKRMIDGIACVMQLVPDGPMMKMLASIDSIPSIPKFIQQVNTELANPEASLQKIGSLIEQDPGMSAKLLQLVNSAFFGMRGEITRPEAATTILGLTTIKALITAHGIFQEYESDIFPKIDLDKLWTHGSAVAQAAKAIARKEKMTVEFQDMAFLSGLLHDIGKLILATNAPSHYGKIVTEFKEGEKKLFELEIEQFEISHAEAAAYVLGLWGMPFRVVEAISAHHNTKKLSESSFSVSHAVYLANELHNEYVLNSRYLDDTTNLMSVKWDGQDEKLPVWKKISYDIFNQEQ
jgi:putative nucleotidyltransferase with HDIG domain